MTIDNEYDAICLIFCELYRARHMHPDWPRDTRHAIAIVAEEMGEVVRAGNELDEHGRGTVQHLRTEAIQTGAMVLRFLLDTPVMNGVPPAVDQTVSLRGMIQDQDAEIQLLRAEVNRLHTERQIWMLAQVQP